MLKKAAGIFLFLLIGSEVLYAQTRSNILKPGEDPRGRAELTVCSQNLANYGLLRVVTAREPLMNTESMAVKEHALAERFSSKSCDVIALQEVLGKDEAEASLGLERLAYILHQYNNRFYDYKTGPSDDPLSRVGYLVAKDRAEIVKGFSYNNLELPKLFEKQKPRMFSRGPLELQILVKSFDETPPKQVNLVNFHFKSKHGSAKDAAALEWETYRMQMAEALRRVVESRLAASFAKGETILIVLGDRNSNFDVASAKILEGVLTLKNFQEGAPCRLSKRGVPLCQAGISGAQKLFSVLLGDPQTRLLPGTFRYKKEYSWLDEILMPAESLRYAWAQYDSSGDYDSGVLYEPKAASDHAMVWVRLNW